MARKREGLITAGELQRRLNSDPEWVAAKRVQEAEMEARARYLHELEIGLEKELKDAGIEIKSYRQVIHKPANFRRGIPILVRHMQMEKYTDWQRNSMAQAIAMKDTNPYWQDLLALFRKVAGKEGNHSFEQGLAVALAASYKAAEFETLIDLCEDVRYGYTRALLVPALKRSKDPRAAVTLMKLCADPFLGTELTKWMKRNEKRRNIEGRNDTKSFN